MTTATPLPSAPESVAPVQSAPTPGAPAPADWSLARRIPFRFAFAYLVLYSFPFPIGWLPGTDALSKPVDDLWQLIVPWVGKHVLRLEQDITVFPNGSGDTTYNYVQLPLFLLFSVVAAALWSAVDRRRTQYTKAHDVLRVYVRYVLALTMLSYGFAKVFNMQFPFPSPDRLVQPLGEFSPMGLMWTFMGYSKGYNIFTGGAEVLGGVLLLFRRTTTLGALVVIAVMTNVVALNFFYDVPVKLYSSHLVLMGAFLLLPDLRRLLNVLVLNKPTEALSLRMPFSLSRRVEWVLLGVKVLFVGTMLYTFLDSRLEAMSKYGPSAPLPPLSGLYEVESFTVNGQARPPLLSDASRWRYVSVGRYNRVSIRKMDNSVTYWPQELDEAKKTLTLVEGKGDTAKRKVLTYTQPDAEHLVLQGPFDDVTIEARLKKVDTSKFLLVNRGFNWVQEFPFNR